MAERYHVGNTPQNRHLIRDDEQATTLALAVTPGVAQRIVHALNLVENLAKEVPQRFLVQEDDTVKDSGQPWTPSAQPDPMQRPVDTAARQYLADLFSFLCASGVAEWSPDDVPSPPWLP